MIRCMILLLLLFLITFLIAIIEGYQCRLYLYTDPNYGGSEYGPLDVGSWRYGPFPNDAISSARLYAEGYYCYARLNVHDCNTQIKIMSASPFGSSSDNHIGQDNELSCVEIWSVATPNPTNHPSNPTHSPSNPTIHPSVIPTMDPSSAPTMPPSTSPTMAPTSSCLDYNNETSADGDNEIPQFDYKNIVNINNYNMDKKNVLQFNTSQDINYKHKLIECDESDCIIQCNHSASCLGANIEINSVNQTILLLCSEEYSCPSSSLTTQSVSMANISVVCVGKYACINMDIQVTNISSFNLYCLQYGSCLDVNISVYSNNNDTKANDGIISCISLNSCDNVLITTNSNKTQLIMYQFSEDVTLNNGAGYFYEDDNILCNNDRYLRYETNMIATDDNITNLILDEYDNQIWPCLGVKVVCGIYSCQMSYKINIPPFMDTLVSGCYWISIQHFMRLECQGECVSSPTPSPTSSPTRSPTYPTSAPSFSPTISPSTAPTKPPTTNPSIAPTMTPTGAPTKPPSQSPTRFPTMEDSYAATIAITYIIFDLTSENIELLEDYTTLIIPDIIEIIEANYFVENDIEYKDFAVNALNINGFQDLSNINLKEDQPVMIETAILSKVDIAGILLKKSKSTIFEADVTADLRAFFANNSALYFEIQNPDSLVYTTAETNDDEESYTLIIILAVIVFIGFLGSVYVKWSNGRSNAMVDNAKWIAPLLFTLQIYDFISDINLSYDILTNPLVYSKNIILWCGVFSVACTVIPFLSNLYYGVTIQTQHVIRNNKRAETYFTDKMAIFIALIVCSAGCYPALMIVSSRICNLDTFNSGLTKHELNRLSKIKIRSTITMENGPQLLISIIYSINTIKISNATFLSFVASSLSVILAVSSFYANKLSRKDAEIKMYDLKVYNQDGDPLTQIEKDSIKRKKGRKQELEKQLAVIFGSSYENIEIGSVTVTNSGFIMFIAHHVPRKDLANHNAAYNARYNKTKKTRMRMVIGATQYLQHLYMKHSDGINKVFTMHFFGTIDDKFMVQFIMDNNDNHTDGFGSEESYALIPTNRAETIFGAQSIEDLSDESDNKGNDEGNNKQMLEMTEMKQKMNELCKNMELIMKHTGISDNQQKERTQLLAD